MDKIVKLVLISFYINSFVFGQNNLSQEDITVLKEPADTMMRSYLTHIVDKQFAVRDSLLSTLKSARDWDMRAQTIRDSMISWTGPFPERAPLNARVTGRLERGDYVIEKILFESRPDYLVSANLYLPKNIPGLRPAHLNVIGHAQDGKANERYQRMSIAQVKNGFIVLTIDQLGQGERGLLSAHRNVGAQAFISGTHVYNFMVWDAIRAVDYLVSRPEVDAEKICITGSSGGGMMTTYLLPFEDRIAVAVPTCNPNTWSHRVHANLATDHEQVFFGAFAGNIDPRGDPLFAHVPGPMLLNTTTDDGLNPPRGVWELSTWLYKSYSAHGVPEKFTTSMVRAGHAYNREPREITYAWMLRWTGNDASGFWEADAPLEKEEDLWAATGGSVFNEPGSRRAQELVFDYLREHKAGWEAVRTADAVKDHKMEMAGLIEKVLNTSLDDISVKHDIKETRSVGDINIRSYILEPEAGIILPGVLLESKRNIPDQDVILYMNEKGKTEIIQEMDIVKGILNKGYRIFAVDLRGMGETSPDMARKFWDFLAGKPIFGQRVRDVLTITEWLKGPEVEARNIKLWGTGMCSLYGAFAGVIDDDISGFILEEPLISFESVVQVKVPGYNHEVLLPGILEKFDMPQVYQALCPRPVSVINPYLGDKTPAGESELKTIDQPVLTTYKGVGNQNAWSIRKMSIGERQKNILSLF
jgi:dienelactone hydrolase